MPRELANWIDGFMTYTEHSEPPYLYRKWVGVSTIAAVLQRKCWGVFNGEVFPNLYVVLVGPSGRCRKGTSMSFGQRFLEELGIELCADSITRERFIQRITEQKAEIIHPTQGIIGSHCSLTVFSKELTVLLGRQNSPMWDDLTDLYDCATVWRYETKHKGHDELFGAWVNLLGATTPGMLQELLPGSLAIEGGLASRIIFVMENEKGRIIPRFVRSKASSELHRMLRDDLGHIHNLCGEFTIEDSWWDAYTPWYISQEDDPKFADTLLEPYGERRAAHLWKLSLIASAVRTDSMKVEEEDFKWALDLLEATEVKMPLAFSGVGGAPHSVLMSKIMRYIAMKKQVPMRAIYRVYFLDGDRDIIMKIIQTLCAGGYCSYDGQTVTWLEEQEDDKK